MSFLSLMDDTVDVKIEDLEEGSGVFTLKRALSKDDLNYAFMKVMDVTKDFPRRGDEAAPTGEVQKLTLDVVMGLPDGQLAILEKAIVRWDLTYPESHPDHPQPVPLDPEMIRSLTSAVVDQLSDKVRELNRARSNTEQQNLDKTSLPTITQERTSQES